MLFRSVARSLVGSCCTSEYMMYSSISGVPPMPLRNTITGAPSAAGRSARTGSTSMAGCSVTLLRADDEVVRLWDAPVNTPGLRWGT